MVCDCLMVVSGCLLWFMVVYDCLIVVYGGLLWFSGVCGGL